MTSIATFEAPSNIAFVKYWGTRDIERTLPYNPSISMTLSNCVSRCTVEYLPDGKESRVLYRGYRNGGDFEPAPSAFAAGVLSHLETLKAWAGVNGSFRVATENSFPTGAGMASSASGFSALTLATAAALGIELSPAQASVLARRSGSGSAARSVLGGYVEWPGSLDDDSSAAVQVAASDHWPLCDVVAVVDSTAKTISSRQGHERAPSSQHWARRLEALPGRLDIVRRAITGRSLYLLGPVIEEEAIDMHLVAMSSKPGAFYWTGGTIEILQRLREWRRYGLEAYATIDAGPNVHLICEPQSEPVLVARLGELSCVESVIADRVGPGPRALDNQLI